MKKILVVNNTIFYEEKEKLYLNKETGFFFVELKNLGFDVSAFQISQLKKTEDSFANFSISDKGLKIFNVPRRKSRFLAFFKAFFVIQKAILKNDFVYVFYPGPICMVIGLLCIIYRKPFGLYVRGEQGIESKLSQFLMKRAAVVLSISPNFTDKIFRLNKNAATIRPMIGFSEQDLVASKRFTKDGNLRLIFVGRLVFDKGVFELIEAMRVVKEMGMSVSLKMVGNGPDKEELERKVHLYNLADCISFEGMVSDKEELLKLYTDSDVFVLPTYHEGFPRVLYEAMIMRLGIITTFVGTIEYLMRDKDNCLEIKVKDVECIVESIEKLYENPALLSKISSNAIQTITEYLVDKKQKHAEQLKQFLSTYES